MPQHKNSIESRFTILFFMHINNVIRTACQVFDHTARIQIKDNVPHHKP